MDWVRRRRALLLRRGCAAKRVLVRGDNRTAE